MPVESTTKIEDIQSVDVGNDESAPAANDAARTTLKKGEAVDSQSVVAELDTRGKDTLDVLLAATDTADFALDISPDGTFWFENVQTFSNTDEIIKTYSVGSRFVRLRVTNPAAGGTTADITLGAS